VTSDGVETADPSVVAARTAAGARVNAFLDELSRLGADDLMRTALAASSETPARAAARGEASRLARTVGLEAILDDARASVREYVRRLYDSANYRATMVGLNWGVSEGTVADRVEVARAAEDAVTAAVIEPYGSDALLTELSSAFELVDRGGTVDGALDLTEATARALRPALNDRASRITVVILAFVGIVVAAATGYWIVAVALVLAAGVVAVVLRRGPDTGG
jgi:hypothetical protein